MKKVLLSLLMCVMALTASAQIKTIDAKLNLRGDFGIGVGMTTGLTGNIDFAPSFNYYFGDVSSFTIDGDFHMNFPVGGGFELYPLAGPAIFHAGGDADMTKFGVNVGGGGRYDINGRISVFAEAKYQFLFDANGADDTFLTVGVSFPL